MKQNRKKLVFILISFILVTVFGSLFFLEPGIANDTYLVDILTSSNGEEVRSDSNAQATPSIALLSLQNVEGEEDLWKNWNGTITWNGEGSEENPYRIQSLSDLMGLSEKVSLGWDYADTYFELQEDIDLSKIQINGGNWNPIGWYTSLQQNGSKIETPFRGHFNGNGNRIYGLSIGVNKEAFSNIGLFGLVDGGSIKNLDVECEMVMGLDNVGILAGCVTGDAIIEDIKVEGILMADGDVGGLIGEGIGNQFSTCETVTIENSIAHVSIYSQNQNSYIGGIMGNAQQVNIIDGAVKTYDGDSTRIQGQGYVGGIVGRMNESNVWNVMVEGTIGGNGSRAIGGIVGKYESGDLILARMAGNIGRSNQGIASREGTFVGTRDNFDLFSYGTEKNSNLSYLFSHTKSMSKKVFGSEIDYDNTFDLKTKIGYWTDQQRNVILLSSSGQEVQQEDFFYEFLEEGVRYLERNKISNDKTDFELDRFAPNRYGSPIQGYLIAVPRIDTNNADGTFDTDVASFVALGVTTNAYYKIIDKDSLSSVAPGDLVKVTTAAKNTDNARYQMAFDQESPGRVLPPTYTDETGKMRMMTYVSDGIYTFTMPKSNTEINVVYTKVSESIRMNPTELTIRVIQTREGNRKDPQITNEVYTQNGILIAKYVDDIMHVEPTPIPIEAVHNQTGSVEDGSILWSLDDMNLLHFVQTDEGYTHRDAYVIPNLESKFIRDILLQKEEEQREHGFNIPIDNKIYKDIAVVTASSNPKTSTNYTPVIANTKVSVTFQILDYTTTKVEKISLNEEEVTLKLKRILTGNPHDPTISYECSEPYVLQAFPYPKQSDNQFITWSENDINSYLKSEIRGGYHEENQLQILYDVEEVHHPAWIQNIVNKENEIKKNNPYTNISGSRTQTVFISATSNDQSNGILSATCRVTIEFVTEDKTINGTGSNGYSSKGSSSGGGSGGGGSISGVGSAVNNLEIPVGAVQGNWTMTEQGNWNFATQSGNMKNQWAFIEQPNTAKRASWFYFLEDGTMATGMIQLSDGHVYYLQEKKGENQGQMETGWININENWYYFNPVEKEGIPLGAFEKFGENPILENQRGIGNGQWNNQSDLAWVFDNGEVLRVGDGGMYEKRDAYSGDPEHLLKEYVRYPEEKIGTVGLFGNLKSNYTDNTLPLLQEFVNGSDWMNMSEIQRLNLVYNRIAMGKNGNESSSEYVHVSMPVLEKGGGVCEDYAEEFELLAKIVGLECVTYQSEPFHVSNLVKIGEQWITVDPYLGTDLFDNKITVPVDYEKELQRLEN